MYQTILISKNNGSGSEKSSKAESDILVFSKSSEEHLTHLQDVFKCSVRPENVMELQRYPGMLNYTDFKPGYLCSGRVRFHAQL